MRSARSRARRRLRALGVRSRQSRTAQRIRLGVGVAAVLIGLGIVWIFVTALLARSQAEQLQSRLSQVKTLVAAGDIKDARQIADELPDMARRASRLTSGPAWWVAANIPYLGDPLDTARASTGAALRISTQVVPKLMSVASSVDPTTLRVDGNTVRLAPLAAAAAPLTRAAMVMRSTIAELASSPPHTWLGPIDNDREQLISQLQVVEGYVDAAARTARVLPQMLGASTPQRYFIGLQNEAEARGTGGLPGAFAIAVASHGTVTFTHFESDAALLPGRTQRVPTGLDFGANYDAAYGANDPTSSFQDSNVSPNFPYAAQIWAAMWTKVSGEPVDGAIAVDPTTLAYFLNVVGPTQLSGGTVITAQNVVELTERDQYAIFSDNAARRKFLVSVLKATADKITSGAGNPIALVQAASVASTQQRMLVWSRDRTVEDALEQSNYAGDIPSTDRPFAGLVLNNASGGKIDYYVTRSLTYSRTGCGPDRQVTVHITITNHAPASGLPAYVTGRLDHPPAGTAPGGVQEIVDYYATAGARFTEVKVNGRVTTATSLSERGHPIFRIDLQVPRGSTQDIVFKIDEPVGTGSPLIWRQPAVTPIDVQSFEAPC